jgi:hypothetical protein
MSTSRLLSLAAAALDTFIIISTGAPPHSSPWLGAGNALPLIIPLGLIWFCDILGAYVGPVDRGGFVNVETPGWMIAAFGWLLLLAPIAWFIYHLSTTAKPATVL